MQLNYHKMGVPSYTADICPCLGVPTPCCLYNWSSYTGKTKSEYISKLSPVNIYFWFYFWVYLSFDIGISFLIKIATHVYLCMPTGNQCILFLFHLNVYYESLDYSHEPRSNWCYLIPVALTFHCHCRRFPDSRTKCPIIDVPLISTTINATADSVKRTAKARLTL